MRLQKHRDGIWRTPEGGWVTRMQGKWTEIPPPPDADTHSRRVPPKEAPRTTMHDPQERDPVEVPLVTVRRVIRRTVPDYEAAVLVRHGWEYDV